MPGRVRVLVEHGARRTFAIALDWPGWARGARDEAGALDALESYRARYAEVLTRGGVDAPIGALSVTEHVDGDAGTEFGVTSSVAVADGRALRRDDRARHASILESSWSRFDEVASHAGELARGPRGGGRTLSAVQRHVTDAEVAYARGLGLSVRATDGDPAAIDALRARLVAIVLGEASPDREPRWPLRYGVRRIAWHVLDHLFEIEDRSSG